MPKRPEMIPRLQAIAARVGVPWEEITVQEWRPMHCDCVHEQWFHDGNPLDTVDWEATQRSCPHHAAGSGRAAHDACRDEDLRYGRARQVASNLLGREHGPVQYAFTDARVGGGIARVLEIDLSELSASQRSQARAAIDAQFGPGAVVVR